MSRPKVLLADDHAIVLEGLERLLAPEFDLVATVHNGVEMVEACATHHPDVVVADVSMPLLRRASSPSTYSRKPAWTTRAIGGCGF